MQLVARGSISLDDSVYKYIPELNVSPPLASPKLTIRSILQHRAGLPEEVWTLPEFSTAKIKIEDVDLINQIGRNQTSRKPGQAYAYSNAGFEILRVIIERVSGESFIEFTKKYIFDPLGMSNTSFDESSYPILHLSKNYGLSKNWGGESNKPIEFKQEFHGYLASAALISTQSDMIKFLMAINSILYDSGDIKVLDRKYLNDIFSSGVIPELDKFNTTQPGLGVFLDSNLIPGEEIIVNYGSAIFHKSAIVIDAKRKLSILISGNTNTIPIERLAANILGILVKSKHEILGVNIQHPTVIDSKSMSSDIPHGFNGKYANSNGILRLKFIDNIALVQINPFIKKSKIQVYSKAQDGWYSNGYESLRPENISEEKYLLFRDVWGNVGLFAQRIPDSYMAPAGISKYLGGYILDKNSISAKLYPGVIDINLKKNLCIRDGILMFGLSVLVPDSGNTLRSYGPSILGGMARSGLAVSFFENKIIYNNGQFRKNFRATQDPCAIN